MLFDLIIIGVNLYLNFAGSFASIC